MERQDWTEKHFHAQWPLLISQGFVTKDYKQGGLKQHAFVFPKFGSLEVWNQGVGRAMLPLTPVRETVSTASSFWWFAGDL